MLPVRLLLFLVPSSLWGDYEWSWVPKRSLQHPAQAFCHMEWASWGNQAVKTLLILGASFSRKLFWPHNSNPFPRALRVTTPGSLNSLIPFRRHLRNTGMATRRRPTPEAHDAWPVAGVQRPASSHSYACGQGRSPALWRLDAEVCWHASWRRVVSRLLGWMCVLPWAAVPANAIPGPGIRGGLLSAGKTQPKQVLECAKLAL